MEMDKSEEQNVGWGEKKQVAIDMDCRIPNR